MHTRSALTGAGAVILMAGGVFAAVSASNAAEQPPAQPVVVESPEPTVEPTPEPVVTPEPTTVPEAVVEETAEPEPVVEPEPVAPAPETVVEEEPVVVKPEPKAEQPAPAPKEPKPAPTSDGDRNSDPPAAPPLDDNPGDFEDPTGADG